MKTFLFALAMTQVPAEAQSLDLHFDGLAAKAKQKVEIDLSGAALQQTLQQAQGLGALLKDVNRLVIREYGFANSGEYSDQDLEPLHNQITSAAGWTRIIRAKDKDDLTEIYVFDQGATPSGFLIIAGEAKQLAVIQISGSVPLEQLQEIVKSTVHYDFSAPAAGTAKP